jgi:23S rRNA (cytidine1920-2'-O)/16S rRNA (cytidine1409-2'-O)-methyltransferase
LKNRADLLLVERGLFASRAKAREAIEAGLVLVDGVALTKPSDMVDSKSKIEAQKPYRWVSRGGLKLEAGLTHFQIDAKERICLDVGSSTGGFTDVLLSRGAAQVFAVDVGQDQLHERLRRNKRVVSLEQTDARNLDETLIPDAPSLVVCDASFIGLETVLPAALARARPGAHLIALIKPQFEVGKGRVGKGGVVRDPELHREVCERIVGWLNSLPGWAVLGVETSPITGPVGNVEFLVAAALGKEAP